MNTTLIAILVSIFLAGVGVVADIFMKFSGSGPKFIDVRFFTIGSLIYITTIFGWFYIFKYLKVSTIGVFYGVSSLLFLVLIGVFYFKEPLNFLEIIGISLAFISMIILGRFA